MCGGEFLRVCVADYCFFFLRAVAQERARGGARHAAEARRGVQHRGAHGGREVSSLISYLAHTFQPNFALDLYYGSYLFCVLLV